MKNSLLRALTAGVLLMAFGAASAQVALKDDHPDVYYVKEGDTLWDIATTFLDSPWRWPEIWHVNEEISNPHLIYPGDVIRVERDGDGEPKLVMERGKKESASPDAQEQARPQPEGEGRTVELSPKMKEVPQETAIPSVSLKEIQPFLQGGAVVSRQEIAGAPNVVGGQDARVTFGQGDTIYARDRQKRWNDRPADYGIYRVGEEYVDPETREILGYEARRVGQARVTEVEGDMAVLHVHASSEDIRADDRLFMSRNRDEVRANFQPSGPSEPVTGSIIRFFGRLNSVAKNDVVVIDRGQRDGLEPGNMLAVYQDQRVVRDEVSDQLVSLPSVKAGSLLLFRVFDKVSYGLVVESKKPLKKKDVVTNPGNKP
jgi:nucleoid-associated protein YgaU